MARLPSQCMHIMVDGTHCACSPPARSTLGTATLR